MVQPIRGGSFFIDFTLILIHSVCPLLLDGFRPLRISTKMSRPTSPPLRGGAFVLYLFYSSSFLVILSLNYPTMSGRAQSRPMLIVVMLQRPLDYACLTKGRLEVTASSINYQLNITVFDAPIQSAVAR